METDRIPQILKPSQLANVLYIAIVPIVGTNTRLADFKNMPITRTDYYQLKNGNMIMSFRKLNKVCEWLKLPAPKIYL